MRWILILLLFQALAHEIHTEDLHKEDALNEHVIEPDLEPDNKYNDNNLRESHETLEKREVLEDRNKRAVNKGKNEDKNGKKPNGKNGKKVKKGKKQKGKKNIRDRQDKSSIKKNKGKKVKRKKGKKKKTRQKKLSSGGKKNKPKKKKKKKKKRPKPDEGTPENTAAIDKGDINKVPTGAGRAAADEATYTGPWGFQNPDLIDWTKPEYRCPECEDTLILYDPWWAPPPILHIPIYCTSNLSSQSSSEGVHNWGPNLTFIWIPGSLNCTNKAKLRSDVQFSVEISQNTSSNTGSDQTYYDCGENEAPNEKEVGCQEEIIEHHTNKTSHTCFWHMYAYEHWRRQLEFTHWQLPINDCDPTPDSEGKVRGLGECCESGPHLKISWTGYAKGFKSYCGPDEPVFYKTPFDKGRARWLIIYNNTHDDHTQHDEHLEFDFKAHTIGYRRTAAIDQYYYGQRCECGLKPRKPSTKMIAEDKLGSSKKKKRTKSKKGNKKKNKNKKNKNKKGKKKKKNVRKIKKQNQKTGKGEKDKKEKKEKNDGNIKRKNKKKKGNGLLVRSQRYAEDIKEEVKDKIKKKKPKGKKKNKNNKKPKQNKNDKPVKKNGKIKNIKYKKIMRKKKRGKKNKGKKKKDPLDYEDYDYDYERDYYDIKSPPSKSARKAQTRAESPGDPTERTVGEWPWITSLTYDNKYVCSGYIVSPKFVVAVTKCFHIIDGMSASAIEAALTSEELSKIEVVVYDKVVDKDESHEAIRSVSKVFVNNYCDPSRLPQHCVLLLQLNQAVDFGINGDVWGKPKPICSTCVVSTFEIDTPKKAYPVKLRGYPFLVSFGLRDNQKEIKYGTYKNDRFLNSRKLNLDIPENSDKHADGYLEKTDCPFLQRVGDHFNNITEWYCIPQMGNKYTCDKDTVDVGGTPVLGTRDYGAPLFQRIGRAGYKITWQVIAMLWDFQCGQGGNAAYIPTWGFTQWVTDTIWKHDEPCIKRVRKSLFTAKVSQTGKGPYPEHNMTKPNKT